MTGLVNGNGWKGKNMRREGGGGGDKGSGEREQVLEMKEKDGREVDR